jgi:ABC-2 type transport system permease protein
MKMKGLLSLYYREMRIWSRTYWMMIVSLSTPILYILLFGLVMTRLVQQIEYQGKEIDYLLFLLPGMIAMGIHSCGVSTCWTPTMDRQMGTLEQILSSPTTRSAYGFGKILSVVTQSFIQVLLILVVGLPLVGKAILVNNLPLLLFSAFLGGVCFCSFYMILASAFKSNDLLSMVSTLIMMPMMFCSSMFYPLDMMPSILRYVAYANPMTYIANSLRVGLIGSWCDQVLLELLVLCAFSIALFYMSVLSLKRIRI